MAIKQETVDVSKIKYGENGLVPVIAQDYESGEVLLLATMNAEAVEATFATGYAHYYDAQKKEVVKQGGAKGNTQPVKAPWVLLYTKVAKGDMGISSTTSTRQVALFPLGVVAVTVALPKATAVKLPSSSTRITKGSELSQIKVRLVVPTGVNS